MRKQEEFSVFATLKLEAARLQSERNGKLSQTGPRSERGGILRSALVVGLVDANAVTEKGRETSASHV